MATSCPVCHSLWSIPWGLPASAFFPDSSVERYLQSMSQFIELFYSVLPHNFTQSQSLGNDLRMDVTQALLPLRANFPFLPPDSLKSPHTGLSPLLTKQTRSSSTQGLRKLLLVWNVLAHSFPLVTWLPKCPPSVKYFDHLCKLINAILFFH